MSSLRAVQALTNVQSAAIEGLSRAPKSLPPWLFYDERGSQLFEALTRTPEYYLTRTEGAIFQAHAEEIMEAAGAPQTIIELGAGSAEKIPALLAAALTLRSKVTYIPIDVCAPALESAADHICRRFPTLRCRPIVANYVSGLPRQATARTKSGGPKLVLYIGSSIGNFDPPEATAILARIARSLSPGDSLLLGVDHVKDESALFAAYNDEAGITAEFNLNMLARLNHEAGTDFCLDEFRHLALWNPVKARIEMYLESLRAQRVTMEEVFEIDLAKGERIHTENSYKFTPAKVRQLLDTTGFRVQHDWRDEQDWFGVYLAQVQR